MLKEMKVFVKRIAYEEYTINEENGYEMPKGTKDTLDFVYSALDGIKGERLEKDKLEVDEKECEIVDVKYEDL